MTDSITPPWPIKISRPACFHHKLTSGNSITWTSKTESITPLKKKKKSVHFWRCNFEQSEWATLFERESLQQPETCRADTRCVENDGLHVLMKSAVCVRKAELLQAVRKHIYRKVVRSCFTRCWQQPTDVWKLELKTIKLLLVCCVTGFRS